MSSSWWSCRTRLPWRRLYELPCVRCCAGRVRGGLPHRSGGRSDLVVKGWIVGKRKGVRAKAHTPTTYPLPARWRPPMLANLLRTAEPDPNILAHTDGLCPLVHMEHGKPHTRARVVFSSFTRLALANTIQVVVLFERGLRNDALPTPLIGKRVLTHSFSNFPSCCILPEPTSVSTQSRSQNTTYSANRVSEHQVY